MKQSGANLRDHGNPGCLQAVEESFREVEHAKEVDGDQIDHNVGICMLDDFFLLTQRAQYRLRKQ